MLTLAIIAGAVIGWSTCAALDEKDRIDEINNLLELKKEIQSVRRNRV